MRAITGQILVLLVLALGSLAEGLRIINDNTDVFGANLAGAYVAALGGVLLFFTGIFIYFSTKNGAAVTAGESVSIGFSGPARKVWLLVLLFAAYATGVDILGYLISTVAFFLVYLRFFGAYAWLRTITYSLAFSIVFYVIFVQVGMALPTGVFGV